MTPIKLIILVTIIMLGLAANTMLAADTYDSYILETGTRSDLDYQESTFLAVAGFNPDVGVAGIISYIVKVLLSFLGVIFVVLIIYAGFLWLTSAGNEDKISKAKKIMTAAVIGLAIILAAYTITYFVIDKLLEATKGGVGLE